MNPTCTISRIELSAPRRKMYSVYAHDTHLFDISENTLVHFALRKGMSLPAEAIESIKAYQAFDEARQQALRYLNGRPHLESELSVKLIRKGYDKVIIHKVLDYLRDKGFLDDARYIEQFVQEAIRAGKSGPLRIRQKLLTKGADRGLIDTALLAYDDAFQEEACRLLVQKKRAMLRETDPKSLRNKLGAFLQNKGFLPHIIYKVIDSDA